MALQLFGFVWERRGPFKQLFAFTAFQEQQDSKSRDLSRHRCEQGGLTRREGERVGSALEQVRG